MTKAEVVTAIDAKLNLAQGCAMFAYIVGAVPWRDTVRTFVGPGSITIRSARFEHILTFTPNQILKRHVDRFLVDIQPHEHATVPMTYLLGLVPRCEA